MPFGGNRRHRRKFGLPLRPVRWFSGIVPGTEDVCVQTPRALVCHPSEGPTSFELIQGTSDFDVLDKQEVTVTRVVGDIDVRYSQFVNPDIPQFQIPCVRLGLMTLEGELDAGAFEPPNLWDPADVEETSFMWLKQFYMDRVDWSPLLEIVSGGRYLLSSYSGVHVDVRVNRKIGRAGHVLLIAQTHFDGPPTVDPIELRPFTSMTYFLRALVKT